MKILTFIKILIMNKQHSDISEANPYVNVFLFNMEQDEDSKTLSKEGWSCLSSMTCCHIISLCLLCMLIKLDFMNMHREHRDIM